MAEAAMPGGEGLGGVVAEVLVENDPGNSKKHKV